MAQVAADTTAQRAYILIDPTHTGGRDLVSNIVIPDDMLARALVIANDARLFDTDDDDDGEVFDEDVLAEVEDDDLGPVLVWRHRRFDKG